MSLWFHKKAWWSEILGYLRSLSFLCWLFSKHSFAGGGCGWLLLNTCLLRNSNPTYLMQCQLQANILVVFSGWVKRVGTARRFLIWRTLYIRNGLFVILYHKAVESPLCARHLLGAWRILLHLLEVMTHLVRKHGQACLRYVKTTTLSFLILHLPRFHACIEGCSSTFARWA